LDVKNTFLNGDQTEEVYLSIPPGFTIKNVYANMCKLKKALQGLKQTSQFEWFSHAVKRYGFSKSGPDYTFILWEKRRPFTA